MGKWILVSKMVFTVMLMFCTCHPAKQPVHILSPEKHECQLFIVLWSYMSQMCKNFKENVVKQGGKNKFYATSLLHPCMMHLAWAVPDVWELSGCGVVLGAFNLCVGNAGEKGKNHRNYQFFLENSLCFGFNSLLLAATAGSEEGILLGTQINPALGRAVVQEH